MSGAGRGEDASKALRRVPAAPEEDHDAAGVSSYSFGSWISYQLAPCVNVSPTMDETTCRASEHLGGTISRPSTWASHAPPGVAALVPMYCGPQGNQPTSTAVVLAAAITGPA